jgi:hypothetical protein
VKELSLHEPGNSVKGRLAKSELLESLRAEVSGAFREQERAL